ncbi:FlgO family outer membrane protein [Megalodesulfovibrio paquesii]
MKSMLRLAVMLASLALFWALSAGTAGAGTLPALAHALADDLNFQLGEQIGLSGEVSPGHRLIITTPVNLNSLEISSPLARQLAEELATNFSKAGYVIQEIRRANTILFRPDQGEFLLTRRVGLVNERNIKGALIMAGTYVATSRHVRFTIKLMDAASLDVLAMSSLSLPVDQEAMELMDDGSGSPDMSTAPSVRTTFHPGTLTMR